MKPVNIKEARQKEVRRLLKRQWEISKQISNLGLVKLDKPIRYGWYKEIKITHRVENYKHKEAILEVYNKIEKAIWAKTKEKVAFKWQKETSRHLIYKDVPTLSKKQYNKLSDGAKAICVPFRFYECKHKIKTRYYVKLPKRTYKIKFTRAYITHRKRIDPLLESEYDFIESELYKKGYYNITEAHYSWSNSYWNRRINRQEKLKTNKSLKALKKEKLEDIINDTISWERN